MSRFDELVNRYPGLALAGVFVVAAFLEAFLR